MYTVTLCNLDEDQNLLIPNNIKREHILKAIEAIQISGIPAERISDKYDLKYNNKIYPPKYVISIANKYANRRDGLALKRDF
jgi:hypothetical protein